MRGADTRQAAGKTSVKAASRLAKLREGTRPLKPIVWPGCEPTNEDARAVMKILVVSEVQECQAHAKAHFAALNMDVEPWNYQMFEEECLTQILFRAIRDAKDPDRLTFAVDVDDLRDNTTIDERAAVFQLYRDFCAEHDPDPQAMDAALVREIDDLVKKKDAIRLRALGSSALASYLLTGDGPPSSSPSGRSESSP